MKVKRFGLSWIQITAMIGGTILLLTIGGFWSISAVGQVFIGGPIAALICVFLIASDVRVSEKDISGPSTGISALFGSRVSIPLSQVDRSNSLDYLPWTPFGKCVIRSTNGEVIQVPSFLGKEKFD